jgi:hypothetical protein
MLCNLNDFRCVAMRYDRFPVNFLATVCFPAPVVYGYVSERSLSLGSRQPADSAYGQVARDWRCL